MFGKMNIDKAAKYFISHRVIHIAMIQIKSDDEYNHLAYRWNHLENLVLNDFKRKYRIELSLEQRWHIFLSIMSTLPFSMEKSLDDFLQSGINEIARWSIKAKGDYQQSNYPETPSGQDLAKGFPYFPLFVYSLNNHEVIYPNNKKANQIIEHLQKMNTLKGREEIWSWYSRAWDFHSLPFKGTE